MSHKGLGLKVWGLGLVEGSGAKVRSLGLKVWGFGA